ncbi:hypothetical protein [Actinacidiphila bryophytorum]|uniref:Uncharacterized protein n=1 Tax=Actinacidiphila bryophytorum TaxID=1436133 RepID=A0A9W4E6N1_9ACTN|nr:hypothetical protein [Actinacidiphila bryophytorum]MBM9434733.1 hypothetical protein [Actinacidiphila bryophytorum]MBN6546399.1 hypothetical protein [Actinacidiphila bryophytorum]CAG7629504.1 hypothetical protein SBRY_20572 [Actinacidiphila bryophytorum]
MRDTETAAAQSPQTDERATEDGGPQRETRNAPRSEGRAGTDRRPGERGRTDPASEERAKKHLAGAPAATAAPQAAEDPAVGGGQAARVFGRRMDHAVHDFVEDPRRAVREADAVLDEVIGRVQQALEARRQALREGSAPGADTEALRVALTRYRDLTGSLLTLAE